MKPLGTRVILKLQEQKPQGRIEIPDAAKKPSTVAKVIAIGSEVKEVKVKDLVQLPKYNYSEIEVDGETFIVVKEEDIFCVL